MDRASLYSKGEQAAKRSFIAVAVMGAIKGVVGLSSGSVSLVAQAVDSVTDLLALVAVFVGMRLIRRPPSKTFPYGYFRLETLASLFIAVLILVTGSEMLRESAVRVMHPEPLSAPLSAVLVAGGSIPVLYILARYAQGVGEEINSQSLLGQAADFRADVYSSSLVLMSVVASQLGYPIVDGVAGALISLIVLRMGLSLGRDALLVLVDAVKEPEKLELIGMVAGEVIGVLNVQRVRMRRSGPFCLGELTISVDKRLPVDHAHRLADEVENRIKERFPDVEYLVIHIEPQARDELRLAIPVLEDQGMDSLTARLFGEAPYFLFVDIAEETILRWMTWPNPAAKQDRRRGLTTTRLLVDEGATTILAEGVGEGPFHMLRNFFIDIYGLHGSVSVSLAVNEFLEGKLHKIEDPEEVGRNRKHDKSEL